MRYLVPIWLMLACSACRIGPPLPAADFSKPGWIVQQGQAVWKPSKHRPELAGDLLLATNANGNLVVQFTKIPFSIANAEVMNHRWQIDFGSGKYVFRNSGEPPKRFSWFQLPHALAGENPPAPWQFNRKSDGGWKIENPRTGESLEGVFFQ